MKRTGALLIIGAALVLAGSAQAHRLASERAGRGSVAKRTAMCLRAFHAIQGGRALLNTPLGWGECNRQALAVVDANLPGIVLQDQSWATRATERELAVLPPSWLRFLANRHTTVLIGQDWHNVEPDAVLRAGAGGYFDYAANRVVIGTDHGVATPIDVHEVVHVIDWSLGWHDAPQVVAEQQQLAQAGTLIPEWAGDGFDPGRGELLADAVASYLTGGRSNAVNYYGAPFVDWIAWLLTQSPR